MAGREPRTASEQRAAARTAALRHVQEQERRAGRRRALVLGGVVAALLVVAGIWYASVSGSPSEADKGLTSFPADVTVPSFSDDAGGISFGASGEPGSTSGPDAVRVDLYLDFMCPGCGAFEDVNGADLTRLRESGAVTLVVHPLTFLDSASKDTVYSTRAASAFVTVAERSPEHALAFFEALFENQPQEYTTALSDTQIQALAASVGVPENIATEVTDMSHQKFVEALTEIAFSTPKLLTSAGRFTTPTMLVDGTVFEGDWSRPGTVDAAVTAAADARATS